MAQLIEVPGMGMVEFPDGMSDDQIATAIKANMPQAASKSNGVLQGVGNTAAGLLRGAGSIGATLVDQLRGKLADPVSQAIPDNMRPQVTSMLRDAPRGDALRSGMDAGLKELGAEPDSWLFKGGKLGGEVLGTAGAGGVLGQGAARLGLSAPLVQAIASGGMRAGGASGVAGMATRAAGGAISGGAMTGLVDPQSAGTGAMIGAVTPVAVQGAGSAMKALGSAIRGTASPAGIQQAAQAAQQAGYVIPPTQVRPSLMNRVMEGTAGKLSTAQNASARNQEVTNQLARQALGVADGAPLSPEALGGIRREAGKAYQALRGLGEVMPDSAFQKELGDIASTYTGAAKGFPGLADDAVGDLVSALNVPKFNADSAVDALTVLRDRADAAFIKGDKGVAKATKQAAGALENLLERHAQSSGSPDALKALREARQLIAKTYSVEKALNPATGTVSAQKLASQLQRGKPLSAELKQVAEFGAAFPKAAQTVEAMGSLPQTSPLDWALAGGTSAATANPLGMLMMGVRPAARAAALSGPVQRGLLTKPGVVSNTAGGLLGSPATQGLLDYGVRAVPLLSIGQ